MRASQGLSPGPSPPVSACTIICTVKDTCATAARGEGGGWGRANAQRASLCGFQSEAGVERTLHWAVSLCPPCPPAPP